MLVKYYNWVQKTNNALKFMLIVWGIPTLVRIGFLFVKDDENQWHSIIDLGMVMFPLIILWTLMLHKWHFDRMGSRIRLMKIQAWMKDMGR